MTFPPRSRPARLADTVATDLRRQILATGLREGDQLPTERALGERYGVSRTVIREAVAQLKTESLVEARQGSGVFVGKPQAALFRLVGGDDRSFRSRNLYELRKGVEIAAAGLAATRHTQADLVRLERALAGMGDPATRAMADIDFHVGVAAATRNDFFESFVAFLGNALASAIQSAVRNTIDRHAADQAGVIAEHARVLAAIASGRAEAAEQAMDDHLTGAMQRLSVSDARAGEPARP